MKTMLSWDVTSRELDLISKIAERVQKDLPEYPDKKMTLIMDLTATHANGCKLQLAKLLKADSFDFVHDIYGIRKHINRETGELEDCFVPRYAK